MKPPKIKSKPTAAQPSGSLEKRRAGFAELKQHQFSAVVGTIAKRYGVKVASVAAPTTNPYAMSAEKAAKVAVQAGIITDAGNLTRAFK